MFTSARMRTGVVLAVLLAACTPRTYSIADGEGSPEPIVHRVIFDYSPTISDVGALLFLASRADVELVAVTLPGTGESHCDTGIAHTRGVLHAMGLDEVPVACGPTKPFGRYNSFPIAWRTASDELDVPEAAPNDARSAPDLIADLLEGADEPIEILAVAPLTNLAIVLTEHPELAGRIASITIMGGAVDVPGNVFRNPYGEWNIWVDPTAADVVIRSGVPVTLVPLDATNHVPTSRVFYDALVSEPSTAASELLGGLWSADPNWIDNPEGWVFLWDELAALILVDESVANFEQRTLVVDDDNFENEGWTREDPAGGTVRVAVSADRLATETRLLEAILGRDPGLAYVEATPEEVEYLSAVKAIVDETNAGFDRVFEEVIADRDVDTDEEFVALLIEVIPLVLAGPITDQLHAMEALVPPSRLVGEHEAWVVALRELRTRGDEMIDVLRSGTPDLDAFIDPENQACFALQAEADVRLLIVDFTCE